MLKGFTQFLEEQTLTEEIGNPAAQAALEKHHNFLNKVLGTNPAPGKSKIKMNGKSPAVYKVSDSGERSVNKHGLSFIKKIASGEFDKSPSKPHQHKAKAKAFLSDYEGSVHSDKNYGLDSDSKGKLHELLTAHYLTHGDHEHEPHERGVREGTTRFPKRPDEKSDVSGSELYHGIRSKLHNSSPDHFEKNWTYHKNAARSAANAIRDHLRNSGHMAANETINNVHWTSRQNDIERISGAKDKANKSDIIAEIGPHPSHVAEIDKKKKSQRTPTSKKFVGLSMKIHNSKVMSTLSNPGHGALDEIFKTDTTKHYQASLENAHNVAARHGIDTRSMSLQAAHNATKGHEGFKAASKEYKDGQLQAIANEYRSKLVNAHPHKIADTLSKLANIKKTKMPTLFAATYGGEHNMSHHVDDPHTEMQKLLDHHRDHLTVDNNHGSSTLNFRGKGGQLLGTLQIKHKSSTAFSSRPVGTLAGWSSKAKVND